MRRALLLVAFLGISLTTYAQREKIRSVKVRGEYVLSLSSSNVSVTEAKQLAREDAKRKALEQVCGSRVSVWEQMETSSAGDIFTSLGINQIDGEIIEFNVVSNGEGFEQSDIRTSEMIFYCIADVKVKQGISPDPNFVVAVNGLRSLYYSGDLLDDGLEVLPHQDCYIRIFLLEDEYTGYQLYPNPKARYAFLPAGQIWTLHRKCDIELQKSPGKEKEINRLVFVFTKTERPFNQQITSRPEIEKWIATIPNDQKFLHFSVIEIRDK